MRYIRFEFGTDYCGTDGTDYNIFDDNTDDKDIEIYADDLAQMNAESFEYVATGWDDDFESEEDRESYYEGVWYKWEEISEDEYKEEHGE